ncbi:hypothetical protein AHAS_Ahas19G0201700 [Arachis hypogaea]
MKVEYGAMADLVAKLIEIKNLLIDLRIRLPTSLMIHNDNLNALLLATNPILYVKSKFFKTELHFVQDYGSIQAIEVSHVPKNVQIANVLIKVLSTAAFLHFRHQLRVKELEDVEFNLARVIHKESKEVKSGGHDRACDEASR